MSTAILTQFLIDITRGHLKGAYAADSETVLGSSMLDEVTKSAVRNRDIGALWLDQAHPVALMYFARLGGWDNDRYYNCIARAEATKSVPVAGAPPTAFELPRMR